MSKPWFAQKRFGYGAGHPITWQGWAVIGGYLAVMLMAALIIEYAASPYRFLVVIPMIVATMALIAVTRARTRGGWRWRWGAKD